MKVGSITHNRNFSVESKGSKEKANFSDSFNLARRAKTKEELELTLSNTNNGVDKIKARRIIERINQLTVDLELISKNRRN